MAISRNLEKSLLDFLKQPSEIFENRLYQLPNSEKPSFLKIKFEGSGNNKFGIGARVEAYINGSKIIQENFTARGFQSSVAPEINLGLGKATSIDSLKVIWPSGKRETLLNLEVNKLITLKEENAFVAIIK